MGGFAQIHYGYLIRNEDDIEFIIENEVDFDVDEDTKPEYIGLESYTSHEGPSYCLVINGTHRDSYMGGYFYMKVNAGDLKVDPSWHPKIKKAIAAMNIPSHTFDANNLGWWIYPG
jgi:hypothetical protein